MHNHASHTALGRKYHYETELHDFLKFPSIKKQVPPTYDKIILISKVNRPPTAAAKTPVINFHLTKVADSPTVLVTERP